MPTPPDQLRSLELDVEAAKRACAHHLRHIAELERDLQATRNKLVESNHALADALMRLKNFRATHGA